jgi:hypothetical protein
MRNPFRYFNSSPEVIRLAVMLYNGVVSAKSNTLPACPVQISPPLIFLDFSSPIQAVPRPSQVFRILL